jgi:hypothetical protein
VPEKPTYFSRFAVKFAEILGAGIATAVSGYLVAHLGGHLSWPEKAPAPTMAVEAPSGGGPRTPDRQRDRTTASAPTETHAASDDRTKEPARTAAKPVEVSTPATTAAVAADNDDKRSRIAAPSRKPVTEAHAAKPAPRENAEAKAHEQEAVEEQVRAALANVDASRTPPNTPTPIPATPAPQTAAIPQPQPIPAPGNPAASATSPSAVASTAPTAPPLAVPSTTPLAPPLDIQNAATTPSAPVAESASAQPTTAEPSPLASVEIKSRPIAGVGETSPDAQATADANSETNGKAKGETEKGFFSTIAHLPETLRANAHAPAGDPPRPPMPVGE